MLFACEDMIADAAAAATAAIAAAADELDVCVICCAVFKAFALLRTVAEYSELFGVVSASSYDDNDGRRSSVISSTLLLLSPTNAIKMLIKIFFNLLQNICPIYLHYQTSRTLDPM